MSVLPTSPIRPAAPASQRPFARVETPAFDPNKAAKTDAPTGASQAAIAFESVVLRTFVEGMLPKEGFGEGTAGHMWRGQMAEALADTLAKSGGVGIAATISKETT